MHSMVAVMLSMVRHCRDAWGVSRLDCDCVCTYTTFIQMRGENRRDACLSSCSGGPDCIFHAGFSGVFLLDGTRRERHEKHWYGLHSASSVGEGI